MCLYLGFITLKLVQTLDLDDPPPTRQVPGGMVMEPHQAAEGIPGGMVAEPTLGGSLLRRGSAFVAVMRVSNGERAMSEISDC